ncbi:MAG: hypothetical protein Q9191_001642 [Dirinaria sp. TL-2023a]
MVFVHSSLYTFSTLLLARLVPTVRAFCECGYTVNSTLYTDLIETDFLHLKNITSDTDWQPQEYQVSPALARGPFGKNAQITNVVANPLKSQYDWAGDGVNGGDAGIQLFVRGGNPGQGGLIPMAEMVTTREDILYGSFRAGMKITATNGTCGAFFWYFNDTQEIDMEFLGVQQNDSSSPVNLVLQSPESEQQGFNAAGTAGYQIHQLPYQPDEEFHEYRFDWAPDSVKFYADGVLLDTMTKSIPTSPGHITLSHWSNGDPHWSAGPPSTDAILTVEYLKGYFNSSDVGRQNDWKNRCKDIKAVNATCPVPEITTAPNGNSSAHTFFFSQQTNMTTNQTVSGSKKSDAPLARWTQGTWTIAIALTLLKIMDWCL